MLYVRGRVFQQGGHLVGGCSLADVIDKDVQRGCSDN
jgi:hypothetical protein